LRRATAQPFVPRKNVVRELEPRPSTALTYPQGRSFSLTM
jgi:hypothetical protein